MAKVEARHGKTRPDRTKDMAAETRDDQWTAPSGHARLRHCTWNCINA